MDRSPRWSHRGLMAFGVLTALLPVGCSVGERNSAQTVHWRAGPSPEAPATGHPRVVDPAIQLVAVSPSEIKGPLTLGSLLELARRNHPDLAAAQANVEAARGQWVQAGLYPNPTVGWESEEMGLKREGGGKQGPFYSQEIVTAGKLQIAQAAAGHGITVADWQAVGKWHEIATMVRQSYYDVVTAHLGVVENEKIVEIAKKQVELAESLQKAGTGTVIGADVLRAKVELDQNRNRLSMAKQREIAARKVLANAVGLTELPPISVEAKLESKVPTYDHKTALMFVLSGSSRIQEAQAMVLQAEGRAQLASVQAAPNVVMRVRPAYDFGGEQAQMNFEVGVGLPVYNRNEGNIMAARAEAARAAVQSRRVGVELSERLTLALERYENALRQVVLYEKETIPNAQKALEQLRQVFEAKGERYYDLLDAQRTLSQLRLDVIAAQRELWRAVAEIEGLLQREP